MPRTSTAKAEPQKPKPDLKGFLPDVLKRMYDVLPDRLRTKTEKLWQVAEDRKLVPFVTQVLEEFGKSTNTFIVFTIARLVKWIPTGVFDDPEMQKILIEKIRKHPEAADSLIETEARLRLAGVPIESMGAAVDRAVSRSKTPCPEETTKQAEEDLRKGDYNDIIDPKSAAQVADNLAVQTQTQPSSSSPGINQSPPTITANTQIADISQTIIKITDPLPEGIMKTESQKIDSPTIIRTIDIRPSPLRLVEPQTRLETTQMTESHIHREITKARPNWLDVPAQNQNAMSNQRTYPTTAEAGIVQRIKITDRIIVGATRPVEIQTVGQHNQTIPVAQEEIKRNRASNFGIVKILRFPMNRQGDKTKEIKNKNLPEINATTIEKIRNSKPANDNAKTPKIRSKIKPIKAAFTDKNKKKEKKAEETRKEEVEKIPRQIAKKRIERAQRKRMNVPKEPEQKRSSRGKIKSAVPLNDLINSQIRKPRRIQKAEKEKKTRTKAQKINETNQQKSTPKRNTKNPKKLQQRHNKVRLEKARKTQKTAQLEKKVNETAPEHKEGRPRTQRRDQRTQTAQRTNRARNQRDARTREEQEKRSRVRRRERRRIVRILLRADRAQQNRRGTIRRRAA
ncbi:hypothetical protein HY990_03865 [Candidatus Micrarchaeota archaeon]|nr:hypothetical protein [Candidatus Micrarchaeota archaeon]